MELPKSQRVVFLTSAIIQISFLSTGGARDGQSSIKLVMCDLAVRRLHRSLRPFSAALTPHFPSSSVLLGGSSCRSSTRLLLVLLPRSFFLSPPPPNSAYRYDPFPIVLKKRRIGLGIGHQIRCTAIRWGANVELTILVYLQRTGKQSNEDLSQFITQLVAE